MFVIDLYDNEGCQLDRKYAEDRKELAEALGEWNGYLADGDKIDIHEEK